MAIQRRWMESYILVYFLIYYPVLWNVDTMNLDAHYSIPELDVWAFPKEDDADLDNLIVVGLSLKEPGIDVAGAGWKKAFNGMDMVQDTARCLVGMGLSWIATYSSGRIIYRKRSRWKHCKNRWTLSIVPSLMDTKFIFESAWHLRKNEGYECQFEWKSDLLISKDAYKDTSKLNSKCHSILWMPNQLTW